MVNFDAQTRKNHACNHLLVLFQTSIQWRRTDLWRQDVRQNGIENRRPLGKMEKKHFNGWLGDSLTNPSQVLEMDVSNWIEVFDGYLLNSLHSFFGVFSS